MLIDILCVDQDTPMHVCQSTYIISIDIQYGMYVGRDTVCRSAVVPYMVRLHSVKLQRIVEHVVEDKNDKLMKNYGKVAE